MTANLTVAVAHRPPYVFDKGGQYPLDQRFEGLLVDLLPRLLSETNITLPFHYLPARDNEGGTLINATAGIWNGMVGELVSRSADIALFPLTLTQHRAAYIDFTYSYVDGGIGLLVRGARPTSTALGFLRPFSWQVWVCLLVTLAGVIVLLHILARLSPLGNYDVKAIRLASARSGLPVEYTIDPGNSLWVDACWAMVNSPLLPRGRSWSIRILQLAFGFFCTVVVNTYTASLASLLTVQNLSKPISSLLDLLRATDPLGFVVNPNGSTYAYFLSTLDPVAQALFSKLAFVPDPDSGMRAVRSGEALAYLTDYSTLQYYQTNLDCKLLVAGDPFGPGNLALGLQKHSPYTQALNKAMIKLRSNGEVDMLRRRWLPADYCSEQSADGNAALEIREITGLFYFLMLVVAVAFAVTAAERWAVWYSSRNPRTFKRIKSMVDRFWFAEQHHKNITLSRRFSALDVPANLPDNAGEAPGRSSLTGGVPAGSGAAMTQMQAMNRSMSLDSVPEGSESGDDAPTQRSKRILRHLSSMPGSSSPGLPSPLRSDSRREALRPLPSSKLFSPFARAAAASPAQDGGPSKDDDSEQRQASPGRAAAASGQQDMSRSGSRRYLLWGSSPAQSTDLDQESVSSQP